MALTVNPGDEYMYRPNMLRCTITKVFPDRHRVNLSVIGSGQEHQEVPYHDLISIPPAVVEPPPPVVINELKAEGGYQGPQLAEEEE